jgi:7,8-dihydropterin-6-yl-methyl-4-(beta-D-ribofuranosyl)aminobenzene 5'-phosphate synthase
MRVTMLLDNISADGRLAAEHGLSLHIETGKHRILFDAGQSDAFARNAETLGIDLSAVDIAFVSHGHYDHTGGIARFLELNDHAPVYVHREAFGQHLHKDGRNIGMSAELAGNPRIVLTDGSLRIDDELSLNSFNSEARPFPSHGEGLLMMREGQPVQDEFRHEQYLSIREAGSGRHVVISGCSHKGVLNILGWTEPDVLIGGFHFMGLDPQGAGREELERAAQALAGHKAVCWTCHCTGKKPFDWLKERLGDRLHYLAGGMSIEI